MIPIQIGDAAAQTWDVIVAGTSFAAQLFVHALPADLRVLCVEKGARVLHTDRLTQPFGIGAEHFAQDDLSVHQKTWMAHSTYEGNSNCWWGCTPRFHPSDFRTASLYGQGVDWPIGYDDLEEIYGEVEALMDINGGGSDHILPRSRPFPHEPHAPSLTDVRLRQHDRDWFAQPSARATGGGRAPCCANSVCHLCPVDAKFTFLNADERFARDNTWCLEGQEVRAVDIGGGIARSVLVRSGDGREHALTGDLFALGANAIFNAGILLRSGLDAPALGRYLHEQVAQRVTYDIDQKGYFGGTSIPGHGYLYYDGPHRSEVAAVLLETYNSGPIRPEPGWWLHRLNLKLIADDLPRRENRVELREDEPHITWHGHSDYAYAGLARARARLPSDLPFSIEGVHIGRFTSTEAHIQGTHRMSEGADMGVVDSGLKCHGLRNVLALGAGAFPTCSPANPTLTLAALSVHAARSL